MIVSAVYIEKLAADRLIIVLIKRLLILVKASEADEFVGPALSLTKKHSNKFFLNKKS